MDLISANAVQTPARNQASLVWSPHPLLAAEGRVIEFDPPTGNESLHSYLGRMGVDLSGPVIVSVDRSVIPRDWLQRVKPKPGTLITVRAAVGDGDGSQVVAIVAMIALSVAAPYLAGAAYGLATSGTALTVAQAGVWAANTTIGMAMTAGVTIAGSMAISALMPKPKLDLGRAFSSAKDSPTYSLSGGSNRSRPYEPLGLTLGRHRVFFDLASRPYTVFEGDDQYLYHVFHVGLHGPHGSLRVEDLRLGDTLLSDYQGVTTEYAVDAMPGIMPYNVDTLAGAAVTGSGGPVVRVTSLDTTRIEVDLQAVLYYSGDSGLESRSVSFSLDYRAVGASEWLPLGYAETAPYSHYWSQGFNSDASGDSIWIQSAFDADRSPAAHTDGIDGWRWLAFDAAPVSDPKPPRTDLVPSSALTLSSASAKPLRKTYGLDVPAGQYEIRCVRASPDDTDSRAMSDLNFVALKSYQSQPGNFSGQCFLAVKVKASGQLNGTLSTLSGIVSQPIAEGVYSSNPADLFLQFAYGMRTDGRLIWGAGLPDAEIDTVAIDAWWAWCNANSLTCNLHIDGSKSVWDVLQAICRCGRASPTWAAGKLGVLWDAAAQPVVAMFGPSNIKRGSFEVLYGAEYAADEVTLNFVDADSAWQADTVRVTAPGVTAPVKPASIELWGCTNRDQALRECRLMLAHQLYRVRQVSWVADMEGLVVTRGDVVMLSHDMTQWGASGRLVGGTLNVLELDREITLDASGSWITVVDPVGTLHTSRVQYVSGPVSSVTLIDQLPSAPDADSPTDWRWLADYQSTPGKRVKITDIRPVSMHEVRISAMDDPDAYYAFEHSGSYVPVPVRKWTSSDPMLSNMQFAEELVQAGVGYAVALTVNWSETGSVASRRLRYQIGTEPEVDLGNVEGSSVRLDIPDAGTIVVSVVGYDGAGRSGVASRVTGSYTIQGAPLQAVTGLTLEQPFVGTACVVRWDAQPDAVGYRLQVWSGATLCRSVSVLDNRYSYTLEQSIADGGPRRAVEFRVSPVSKRGIGSQVTTLTAANPQVGTPIGIQTSGIGASLMVSATKPSDTDYAGTRIWISTTSGFNPAATSPTYDGPNTWYSGMGLAAGNYYVRIGHYDAYGKDAMVTSGEIVVTVIGATGMRNVTSLPANPAAVGGDLAVFLDTATASQRGIWGWDGSAWKFTRDGANLVASSIAADRLAVSQLSAITANLGAMTSGSITLDAAGYIRGGSTGYMTGAGIWMGYHSGLYKMHVGSPTGAGFTWDGSAFTIRAADGSVLLASGSGIPYGKVTGTPTSLSGVNATEANKLAGIQDGATVGALVGSTLKTAGGVTVNAVVSDQTPLSTANQGTFISSLQIGNGSTSNIVINTAQLYLDWWGNASFAGYLNAASGTFSGTLTAAAVNAVNTINIAGNAITVPMMANGTTSASGTITLPDGGWVSIIFGGQIPPGKTAAADRTVTLTVNGGAIKNAQAAYASSGNSSATEGYGTYLGVGTYTISVACPQSVSIFVTATAAKR